MIHSRNFFSNYFRNSWSIFFQKLLLGLLHGFIGKYLQKFFEQFHQEIIQDFFAKIPPDVPPWIPLDVPYSFRNYLKKMFSNFFFVFFPRITIGINSDFHQEFLMAFLEIICCRFFQKFLLGFRYIFLRGSCKSLFWVSCRIPSTFLLELFLLKFFQGFL